MKTALALVLVFTAFMSMIPINVFALLVNKTTELVTPLAAAAGSQPNVTNITSTLVSLAQTPNVDMDGLNVYATRYLVTVDGIEYEAYCADPMLDGPEHSAAIYELKGEAHPQLKNALKNGYPINSEWSDETIPNDDRMWLCYITRVAVAMANHPTRTFTGDSLVINQATSLANGSLTANSAAYPPIMVNGVKDAQDTGRAFNDEDAKSQTFNITYNRKTNLLYNPFTFEWAAGTPAGAKLIVNGTVIATAPANPTTVYRGDITSFTIEMPNTAEYEGKTAAVNLVGIHNKFADTIWLMQNKTNPDSWQDVVFYIPEVSASAAFSFISDVDSPPSSVRIIKRSNKGAQLNGAEFTITGNGKNETVTVNGTLNIELEGWEDGTYTVTETVAPTGYDLSAAPQTFTINGNSVTPAILVFTNSPPDTPPPPPPPPTPVILSAGAKIQKVDALTRENIPGALMRLRGMTAMTIVTGDGQSYTINNTGINLSQILTEGAEVAVGEDVTSTVTDGVWTLEGLPFGFYMVEEERAPQNYSLLPQHTAYGFWLLPPDITINAEGEPVINTESELTIDEGSYTSIYIETVDHIDIEYEIVLTPNPSSVLITFENYPFGKIEVNKYDMVTELPLEGAHFRIQGYFAEGNTNGMPIDRVGITDADGKLVFDNLPAGHYTITEIEAPGGYELDYNEYRAISLTWGQTASTSFYNKPKTFIEVIKIDGDDSSKLLDGAIFRLTDPLSGEIWEGETVSGKVRLGEGEGSYGNQLEAGTVYILTEIQAPPGYVLDPSPKEVILAANNQLNIITVSNFLKPTLTVIKYDELTNEPIAGATFRLWRTEGETWSENQITDADGRIVWTDLDPGIYSVQEIDEPYGYFIDPARKEILLEGGDNKELTFFNRPRPVLIIQKRDQVTGEPIAGVMFRVQALEGLTIGEFITDANGIIELSPQTGYLLNEQVYRVTEVTPPAEYLPGANPVKDVLLKWYEPTELVFENLLKPTLIFIKRDGMSGRGISGATYRVQYETVNGGVATIGSYVTKCGLIVIPYVQPGWYILTETSPATGYQLPTNPTVRVYFAPGENSYTHLQTKVDLYVVQRTNPSSGTRGTCGDWCGFMCSVLCAGNCGNPGDGTTSAGNSNGGFGNLTITNGKGDSLGSETPVPSTTTETTPDSPPDFSNVTIKGGTVVYLNPDFAGITITFGGN